MKSLRLVVTVALAVILTPQTCLDSVAQALAPILSAQLVSQKAAQPRVGFEVVSVKQNRSTQDLVPHVLPGGRLTITGWTLSDLIRLAYSAPGVEVVADGPGWINSDRFDIVAKTWDGVPVEMPMLQSVLLERFKVKVHKESIERPIYELTLVSKNGKLGPQLSVSTCARPDPTAPPPARATPEQPMPTGVAACAFRIGAGPTIIAEGMTMLELAVALKNFPVVDRVVQDHTGLSGAFDFRVQWVPGGPNLDPNAGPDLFTALKDQLGLKLERAKGLVSVIVLDHADRPTED